MYLEIVYTNAHHPIRELGKMMCSVKFTFPPSISDRWLDSSKTLYEQDVKEHDLLFLRFKYYSFMDIDPRVGEYSEGGESEGGDWWGVGVV